MLEVRIGTLIATILRLLALTFVWGTTFAVLFNLNAAHVSRSAGTELVLAALILMIPSAFIVSTRIIKLQQSSTRPSRRADVLSNRELLALLDEDDLNDLRGEIREGLRSRIQRLSDSGPDSFESLLAEAGSKRKRGGR